MCLGQTDIAGLPQPMSPHAWEMRAFDSCPSGILLLKVICPLPLPSRSQGLIQLPSLSANQTGFDLRLGATGEEGTGHTAFAAEPHLTFHPVLRIRVREPRQTLLASRTGHDLLIPIDHEPRFVKAVPFACLPTGVLRHGTDDGVTVFPATLDQDGKIRIALIHQMFGREQALNR